MKLLIWKYLKKNIKVFLRSIFIHQIHLVKSKQESKGIKSYIMDEHIPYSVGTAYIDDYKLLVNDIDFHEPHTILNLHKT